MTTEIVFDSRINRFIVWVWITPKCCERRADRKTYKAARNAALRYGPIRSESRI